MFPGDVRLAFIYDGEIKEKVRREGGQRKAGKGRAAKQRE